MSSIFCCCSSNAANDSPLERTPPKLTPGHYNTGGYVTLDYPQGIDVLQDPQRSIEQRCEQISRKILKAPSPDRRRIPPFNKGDSSNRKNTMEAHGNGPVQKASNIFTFSPHHIASIDKEWVRKGRQRHAARSNHPVSPVFISTSNEN